MMVSRFSRMTGSLSRLRVANGRNQRSFVVSASAVDRQSQRDLLDHLGVGDGAVQLAEHPFDDDDLIGAEGAGECVDDGFDVHR